MFLPEIATHRPAERNRFADGVRAGDAAGSYVPGIWRLFAWKPALGDALGQVAQLVMRGESALSPGFRELIAAFTSARVRCHF